MADPDSFSSIKLKLAVKRALEELQVDIQKNEDLRTRPALSDVVQRLLDAYNAAPDSSTKLLPRNDREADLIIGLLRLVRDDSAPEQLKHALGTLLSPWINRSGNSSASKKPA